MEPYDLVIIDADHAHAAVQVDWENYGKLGAIVAFHDIRLDWLDAGVAKLWASIKQSGAQTEEMIGPQGTGVGIVRREALARAA